MVWKAGLDATSILNNEDAFLFVQDSKQFKQIDELAVLLSNEKLENVFAWLMIFSTSRQRWPCVYNSTS